MIAHSVAQCIFCQVVSESNRDSDRIIIRDQNHCLLAVLHPQTYGHVVLFPVNHIETLDEKPAIVAALVENLLSLAPRLQIALGCKAYNIKANNSVWKLQASDESHVSHIHVHWIPLYNESDIANRAVPITQEQAAATAAFIRNAL